jgi:hypothetical protein
MIDNNIDTIATNILNRIIEEAQDEWLDENSKYKNIRKLQIDKRGSFGERFFKTCLMSIYDRRINIEYNDGDQGCWDLKINNLKLEIKTSSLDVNKKFQNEGIKKDEDYSGILFLGIKPNQLLIKFIKKDDIPFDKLHNRGERGTGRGYKWDFKEKDMLQINTLDDIKAEFEKCFGLQKK